MTSALHHPAQAEAQARSARGLAQFDGTHHLPGQFFFRWSIFGLPWGAFCPVLCQGWRCSYHVLNLVPRIRYLANVM
ncbi:hypothetical protein Pyn_13662 [Prunus yedoensis var. nudiflora]|uniref:Uncharacterized protein n=1 Tax=Prunus yedoensis var. nudiflora TaxID=2094558 RepID=A0A314YZ21_PRUYE|nr:hypothetical protein Pyn_13662 [Prunus yedoensis var. nudiflora]